MVILGCRRSLLGELDFLSVGVLKAATVEWHIRCLRWTTEVSGTPSFDQSRCKQHWYVTTDHLVAHSSLDNPYSCQNCVRFLIHVFECFCTKMWASWKRTASETRILVNSRPKNIFLWKSHVTTISPCWFVNLTGPLSQSCMSMSRWLRDSGFQILDYNIHNPSLCVSIPKLDSFTWYQRR
jgi:hypothetical protein